MRNTSSAAPARADRLLWHEAMRNVTPLRGRGGAISPAPPEPTVASRAGLSLPRPSLDRFSGIDRANAERLKRGQHRIEDRLDLHGMTQAEAHRALATFVRNSRRAGFRCVLVITGRGLGPYGPGVLKSMVPRWLEEAELRGYILAIARAQPRDGGTGALYLMLRRRREPSP
jgi:DNA-nicking Smr family endonuclease